MEAPKDDKAPEQNGPVNGQEGNETQQPGSENPSAEGTESAESKPEMDLDWSWIPTPPRSLSLHVSPEMLLFSHSTITMLRVVLAIWEFLATCACTFFSFGKDESIMQ